MGDDVTTQVRCLPLMEQLSWCTERLNLPVVITVTSWWARWRLKSPVSPLYTQPFIQTQMKENFKAPPHWPLWPVNSPQKWLVTRNMSPFGDVIRLIITATSNSPCSLTCDSSINILNYRINILNRLSALLRQHLRSRLDAWLQWIGQRKRQDETRDI